MTLPILTEDREQMNLVLWLQEKGYKFTAIPNSTFTRSWKQKLHNKDMGLRAGFPDIVVIAHSIFIAIELKRSDGGSGATPAQKSWIANLQAAGIPAKVCNGKDEAVAFIEATVKAAIAQ